MDPIRKMAELEPTKKAFSFFEEFKQFAFKGNVIDLAIGVVIGAAFGKIVDSLVKNIIMPLIGLFGASDQSYKDWKVVVRGHDFNYGLLLSDIVSFLLVALVLWVFIVKFLGWIMRTKKEEAAAPPPLTKEEQLLTEIRDLLAKRPAS
jgi:large conductance mechanosensitive channel